MKKFTQVCILLACCAPILTFAQEKFDEPTIEKIKKEEMENSKVMDIAFHLTDVSGPRLTASPGFARASKYAVEQLKSWGATNAALDPWGDFGKAGNCNALMLQ